MAVIFLAFFTLSMLSDSSVAEKGNSSSYIHFQQKVTSSLPVAKESISTTHVIRTDPPQNTSILVNRSPSTTIHKHVVTSAAIETFNITKTSLPAGTVGLGKTSAVQLGKTSAVQLGKTSEVQLGKTSAVQLGKTSAVQLEKTSAVQPTHLSTQARHIHVNRTVIGSSPSIHTSKTPTVNTTTQPTPSKKDPKKKNLVILYATIFSVVGFVLIVIIGVVIVGCRRSEIKGAFKFSQQLDHQLGTFEDIPRAKVCNSRGNNVVIKDTPVSEDGVLNGVVKSEEKTDGPSSPETRQTNATEDSHKSIENKAYESNPLDPDEESS